MLEAGASPDLGAAAALLVVSFLSFLGGLALRKWPEKIQAHVEAIDGTVFLIGEGALRGLIAACARMLVVLSAAALLAAALVL